MSDLSRFRADANSELPAEKMVVWDHTSVIHQGVWLCFDQAIATTGWAELHASASTGFAVVQSGIISTEATDQLGYEDSFQRGEALFEAVRSLLVQIDPEYVAVELPVAMGSKFKGKRESGLLSCMAVRLAVRQYEARRTHPTGWKDREGGLFQRRDPPRVFPVQSQRAKKVVVGKANATKAEMGAAVKAILPSLMVKDPLVRVNADTMDAVALGLVAATGRA